MLKIGISCYPTYGGSGVIATELGMSLAEQGHHVHFISYDVPRRLDHFAENVFFHEVVVGENPVFHHQPYTLALTSKMVDVAEAHKLDLFHVHYAVPHATSAYLARQILGDGSPKIITTLHGTDITLVGHDASYLPITRFSIAQSDGVTVPSEFLKEATYQKLGIERQTPIEIIPNFVDTKEFSPAPLGSDTKRPRLSRCEEGERVLIHVSNFRAVKQVDEVIRVFAMVRKSLPAHLILVGDGPDRKKAEELVQTLGLSKSVCFFGKQDSIAEILQRAHVFLLPSKNESFGLAALEALSCGLPVVATRVEGIPEVVEHGKVGLLSDLGDTAQMAENTIKLLSDQSLYTRMSAAARERAHTFFSKEKVSKLFLDYYHRVLGR